mmetsp:Transcript_136707/g.237751  ORF Transcript_136707/g.237751 Transcript_136707/m.237751 type:complete len:210 (-) Transcript_136707:48-677(-)
MNVSGPYKIVILGEGRVGKTSLLRRYVSQTFDEREASTQNAAYLEKRIMVRGQQVQLSLWDTAGQERFHALAPIYYRDADGALLVYDITDLQSFERVAKWIEELRLVGNSNGSRPCTLAIVGNKTDLRSQAKVPLADAEAYARSICARHSVASAKSGQGVEETFSQLADAVLVSRGQSMPGRPGRPSQGRPLVLDDDVQQQRPGRKKCC